MPFGGIYVCIERTQWDLPPAQKFLDDVKFRAEGALQIFLSIRE